jgi:hypothetical protein
MLSGTAPQVKLSQGGQGVEQHVRDASVQQVSNAAGPVHGKGKSDNHVVLQGSSSAVGDSQHVENAEVKAIQIGASEVIQKNSTTKMCRRCGVKGHLLLECTALVFCDICRNTDHAMVRCPIPKQPKPIVQVVGQAADALAGYYIPHASIQPTKKDNKMALVSAFGMTVTEEEVVTFLRVLVSDSFAWEVKRLNGFEFKVLFPSKGDLSKMTKFNADMKEEGVTLKFQEYKEEEEYFGHTLPVVWIRTTNLPTILREYVILWALGTLFGVTQEVDMVTTRASSFGRFAVAVLEPNWMS